MIARTGARPGVCVWPREFDGVAEPEPGLELELGMEVDSPEGRSRGGFGIGSL